MRNTALLTLSLLSLAATPVWALSPEERGREIAEIVDKANTGWKGESGSMQLKIINAHGDVTERKMTMKMKEGTTGGDRSLFAFSWPADVNGTKLLTWSHKDRSDDQWLYLPAIKRTKRISSTGKSGSFMGSEFAYEDVATNEIDKYTYKYLRDEALDGRTTWVSERFPKDKDSGYSKTVSWTDQEYKNVLKVDYYDRKGELLKTATFKGYQKFGNLWRFGSIEMLNHQTRKSSIMTWENRALNVDFKDAEFEQAALE